MDPISPRDGRDVRPQRPRLRSGRERLPQIGRHLRFRFHSYWRDLQRDDVACGCARRFAQLPVHFEPVASLAVWFERGSKGAAIDAAFDRRHTPRGEPRTRAGWQSKKGPRAPTPSRGRRWPEKSRSETDFRSGFGHCCLVSLIRICFLGAAPHGSAYHSEMKTSRERKTIGRNAGLSFGHGAPGGRALSGATDRWTVWSPPGRGRGGFGLESAATTFSRQSISTS